MMLGYYSVTYQKVGEINCSIKGKNKECLWKASGGSRLGDEAVDPQSREHWKLSWSESKSNSI